MNGSRYCEPARHHEAEELALLQSAAAGRRGNPLAVAQVTRGYLGMKDPQQDLALDLAASAAGSHAPELLAALRAERARKAQPGLPLFGGDGVAVAGGEVRQ